MSSGAAIAGQPLSYSALPPAAASLNAPPATTIEVGVYRDGENNLDAAEGIAIPQAISTSRHDPSIHMTVEDTTALYGGGMRTYNYDLAAGKASSFRMSMPRDMSGRAELANFVAATLDNSYATGAKQTWLFLIDHGAGDAGGLFTQEPDGTLQHMSIDTLAGAIRDGRVIHARRHPDDAGRKIDGVAMHECFEATVSVAETLAAAGVDFLAASNETTIAPGIPGELFGDVARNVGDPQAMAKAVVNRVMDTRYVQTDPNGRSMSYQPSAAFMVLDISKEKIAAVESSRARLNELIVNEAHRSPHVAAAILSDVASVDGMERDQPGSSAPWHADRPAIELYLNFAYDRRLPKELRQQAFTTAKAIAAMVLAHRETAGAMGFGKDYRDAVGPTVHFPKNIFEIDSLSPAISETSALANTTSGQNAVIKELLITNRDTAAAAA